MSDAPLTVVRAQLSARDPQAPQSLDIYVRGSDPLMIDASSPSTSISVIDYLGRPALVGKIPQADIDAVGSGAPLHISALPAAIDPEADPPSYRLVINDQEVWFVPASSPALAEGAAPAQPPAGSTSIDYLARDFTGLVAMMKSRVSQIVQADSTWALDHPADPLTTILEVLAYAGDHLAFRQDAAGTESYLATARHRLSLRRHARLRDYAVDDGCNARTALVFAVNGEGVLPAGLQVVTLQPGQADLIISGGSLAPSTTVFETMDAQPVAPQLNDLGPALVQQVAYTIAQGAISLTLAGANPGLVAGQLVVLRQLNPPDGVASPFGAQVLRLLTIEEVTDDKGVVTTNLGWHPEDRLKAALTVPPANAEGPVSLYANVVLADHGMSLSAPLQPATAPAVGDYAPRLLADDVVLAAPPPRVPPAPLPQVAAGADQNEVLAAASLMVDSAAASLSPDPRTATACVLLTGTRPAMAGDSANQIPAVTDTWHARPDLLSVSSTERAFAAASEDRTANGGGRLRLRFGDDIIGAAPAPGTAFTAIARSGGGQSGRVRANSLLQVVGPAPLVTWVTNPLPAAPGIGEDSEAVRLFAAAGFRTNLRGIEPDDWERLAAADPLVETANAAVGEKGTPPCTVGLVTVAPTDVTFPIAKARLLEKAVLGARARILQAQDVQMEIALVVYCLAGANIGAVRERLQQRLGAGALADGSPAYGNPANWPLGRPVELDDLVAVIEDDPAVSFVTLDPARDSRIVFRSAGRGDVTADNIEQGGIAIAAHERARFGNDPLRPAAGGIRLFLAASQ